MVGTFCLDRSDTIVSGDVAVADQRIVKVFIRNQGQKSLCGVQGWCPINKQIQTIAEARSYKKA